MNYEPNIVAIDALEERVAHLHRQQKKTHELLSNLGFALRSFKNLNQFLELIPLMVTRVTDAEGGAIILFKKTGQLQIQQLHCQGDGGCDELRHRIETAISQTLVDVSQGLEINFHADLWDKLESQIEFGMDYLVRTFRTPILLDNGERGRLYVFTRNASYEWTADRQKLLQLVADQTAVAIHSDELAVELRKKERLDRELEIGAEIQERLVPKKCPAIPGVELAACYLSADRVGGDYYDFIPANYDRLNNENCEPNSLEWSITIGDVMGKGVPAGLIMTMTRGMLRAEVLNGHSPAQILQHLNRVMYADLENSSRFVTLFYSKYDPATKILSYANAAHNPPLYWQAATQQLLQLDTEGMLIGLEADSHYEEAQIQLLQGDAIVFYTDGFTDAANPNGERFNEENLLDAVRAACLQNLTAQATIDRIVADIHTFTGQASARGDDMTMVVMKIAT
jgi:phosphoserine phosphatase RsbU/P